MYFHSHIPATARPRSGAFALVEFLAIFAIIAILLVLSMGGSFGGKKDRQRNFTGCAKNLQFIHTALQAYANDNNDRFPKLSSAESSEGPLALLMPKATTQTAPFICPATPDKPLPEGESFARKRISYAYVMGFNRTSDPSQFILSDEQVTTLPKAKGDLIFAREDSAPGNNHGAFGGNFLMLDGSVAFLKPRATEPVTFTNGILLNPRPKPNAKHLLTNGH